jgi:hypothetical protein
MKRAIVVSLVALICVAGVFGQDITLIGQDFENLIQQLGQELLPNFEQAAVWGAFPGLAVMPEDTRFFMSFTTGALLGGGVFTFATPDNPDFDVLDVGSLVEEILDTSGWDRAANFFEGMQGFFPYPILRTALGMRFPSGLEGMVDIAGFPQFITGWVAGLVDQDSIKLSALHLGSRIRMPILTGGGPFPALSIGAGYSYAWTKIGYDLSEVGTVSVAAGELHLGGELLVQSNIHSFGIDLHLSKAFGVFVPFIGLSPYYQIARFAGNVGNETTFEAGLDVDTPPDGTVDSTYFGTHPDTAWVDNDLSLLLFGGFDLSFPKFALEVHASWSIGKGSPGIVIGTRWQ